MIGCDIAVLDRWQHTEVLSRLCLGNLKCRRNYISDDSAVVAKFSNGCGVGNISDAKHCGYRIASTGSDQIREGGGIKCPDSTIIGRAYKTISRVHAQANPKRFITNICRRGCNKRRGQNSQTTSKKISLKQNWLLPKK